MSQVVVTTPGPARDTEGMDISARSDYAVRAMLTLAAATDGGTPVSVVRLAAEQELPRKFLEAILADLRRAELVVSRMGASGGYLLARPATQISVGAVIRAVDGPLAEVRGSAPRP
ncbi:RrF2 family transcriptional regulator [Janibacter hoylei]|uniref:RrF2 family transcriptional regulator n=1 Tax=Janibacter hoylei TaxID=364298 RepID=UPI002AA2A8BD|nr:Rrf2 family transcriptional regulator [Janibacter hoylei]